jgi:hypothetical protein
MTLYVSTGFHLVCPLTGTVRGYLLYHSPGLHVYIKPGMNLNSQLKGELQRITTEEDLQSVIPSPCPPSHTPTLPIIAIQQPDTQANYSYKIVTDQAAKVYRRA